MGFEAAASLSEQIADHIGQQIITGRLAPRSRVHELKLAGDLGVSRGSVREALLILESRHLIEIIPRRGAVVSALQAEQIMDFCELYTDLQRSLFGKLAMDRGLNLLSLRQVVARMQNAVDEAGLDSLLDERRRFMDGGCSLLENYHYLSSVLRGLIPAGLRLAHLATCHPDYDARDTLRYHDAMIAALAEHDEARVHELVSAFSVRETKLACSAVAAEA